MQTGVAVTPDYTALLVGLAMTCPLGQDNPVDCPLHEIRELSLAERFKWVKARTRDEAQNILSYHTHCCPRMQDALRSVKA